MLKRLTYKNKYIWRTSDDELQQNCLFDFALFQKKKKILNQAFDRTESVGFFYCQFNY